MKRRLANKKHSATYGVVSQYLPTLDLVPPGDTLVNLPADCYAGIFNAMDSPWQLFPLLFVCKMLGQIVTSFVNPIPKERRHTFASLFVEFGILKPQAPLRLAEWCHSIRCFCHYKILHRAAFYTPSDSDNRALFQYTLALSLSKNASNWYMHCRGLMDDNLERTKSWSRDVISYQAGKSNNENLLMWIEGKFCKADKKGHLVGLEILLCRAFLGAVKGGHFDLVKKLEARLEFTSKPFTVGKKGAELDTVKKMIHAVTKSRQLEIGCYLITKLMSNHVFWQPEQTEVETNIFVESLSHGFTPLLDWFLGKINLQLIDPIRNLPTPGAIEWVTGPDSELCNVQFWQNIIDRNHSSSIEWFVKFMIPIMSIIRPTHPFFRPIRRAIPTSIIWFAIGTKWDKKGISWLGEQVGWRDPKMGSIAVCAGVASKGDLPLLQWLVVEEVYPIDSWVVGIAAAYGHIHILEWIFSQEKYIGFINEAVIVVAIWYKQIKILTWLNERGFRLTLEQMTTYFSFHGKMSVYIGLVQPIEEFISIKSNFDKLLLLKKE